MLKQPLTIAVASLLLALVWIPHISAQTFPDFGYTPPSNWTGRMFELSQEYPAQEPPQESVPWKSIDFRTLPREYMQAVINYCYEGNLDVDFVVQRNTVRKWYHAPWLHSGRSPREFVRGLTRERSSRPFELAATQDDTYQNFAVGVYNPRGGYTIGKVWHDPDNPDVSNVVFPEDTVTFKLLFTTAPSTRIPFLSGSPEWVADINRSSEPSEIEQTKVRLLQVDIAIRDSRSASGAWVFGTFQYDVDFAATSPWRKLRPVALMWGNDPALTESGYNSGQRPIESWINSEAPVVRYRTNPPVGANPPRVLGWAGRANGPVDNPVSSCISCHSTSQIPAVSPLTPRSNMTEAQKLRWFRNLAVSEPFDAGSKSLDFSLQLGVGIQNYQEFRAFTDNRGGITTAALRAPRSFLEPFDVPSKEWKGKMPQQFRFGRDPDEAANKTVNPSGGSRGLR